MKVIGIRNVKFKGNDGQEVTGVSVYLSSPIETNGSGVMAERVFLSTARLNEIGFMPEVGDDVKPEYNKYGKCSGLTLA